MVTTLRILDAGGKNCGIDQTGIQGLRLIQLEAYDNEKIKDVIFMVTTLRILDAGGKNCGIDQTGIQGLRLIQLEAYDNEKITTESFDYTRK